MCIIRWIGHAYSFPRLTESSCGLSALRVQSRRESLANVAHPSIVTRVHVRNAGRSFIRTEVLPTRPTYKALILGQLFIRLLFNFPFLTCLFPHRRHGEPRRTSHSRLSCQRVGKKINVGKNPSRIIRSRGPPSGISFSPFFSSAQRNPTFPPRSP